MKWFRRDKFVPVEPKAQESLKQEIPPAAPHKPMETVSGAATEELILSELRTIYDPEIPVNIVDLGLIYSTRTVRLSADQCKVEIKMTLTAPGCSMSEVLKSTVETKVLQIAGVAEVSVDIVFDPPWHQGLISEAGKLELGL